MKVTEAVAIDHGLKKDEFSKICKLLKQKGYSVCINIMQISEYSEKEIALFAKKIK